MQKRKGFFYCCLIASLALHLLLAWSSRFLPPAPPSEIKASQIEIEIKENKDVKYKKSEQIVRDSIVPDDLKVHETEDPLAFFSNANQRVKKQLRALKSGLTANRAQQMTKEEQKEAPHKKLPLNHKFFELADARSTIKMPRPNEHDDSVPQKSPFQLPQGMSTVGEALPDELEIGSFTALNTDRYLYYSFFARVEELIRYNWENSVRSTIDRTSRATFEMNLRSQWITQVEILLKPNGEFHKALLMKESGINGFDWAAMDCFTAAKIFPHPPKEMIEGDGLIHLRYTFTVRFNPKALVRQ